MQMRVSELKDALAARGLSTAGLKAVLIARLQEALTGATSAPPAAPTPEPAAPPPEPAPTPEPAATPEPAVEAPASEAPAGEVAQAAGSTLTAELTELTAQLDALTPPAAGTAIEQLEQHSAAVTALVTKVTKLLSAQMAKSSDANYAADAALDASSKARECVVAAKAALAEAERALESAEREQQRLWEVKHAEAKANDEVVALKQRATQTAEAASQAMEAARQAAPTTAAPSPASTATPSSAGTKRKADELGGGPSSANSSASGAALTFLRKVQLIKDSLGLDGIPKDVLAAANDQMGLEAHGVLPVQADALMSALGLAP